MQHGLAQWLNIDVGSFGCYPGDLCRGTTLQNPQPGSTLTCKGNINFPEGPSGRVLHSGFSSTFHDSNHESHDLGNHYPGAGLLLTLWLDAIQ
jgi:hypothetical protein